jgi:hypothetical protein
MSNECPECERSGDDLSLVSVSDGGSIKYYCKDCIVATTSRDGIHNINPIKLLRKVGKGKRYALVKVKQR